MKTILATLALVVAVASVNASWHPKVFPKRIVQEVRRCSGASPGLHQLPPLPETGGIEIGGSSGVILQPPIITPGNSGVILQPVGIIIGAPDTGVEIGWGDGGVVIINPGPFNGVIFSAGGSIVNAFGGAIIGAVNTMARR